MLGRTSHGTLESVNSVPLGDLNGVSATFPIRFRLRAMLSGWRIDENLDRDWLYLRITRLAHENGDDSRLAETLMSLANQRFANRLILEFAEGQILTSVLAGQLVMLHKRVHLAGGMLRLCGLSDYNRDVLRMMGILDRFAVYPDRMAAIDA